MHKRTPPNLEGKARLGHEYSAMTATLVNTVVPTISHANWFSYQISDFISQNQETSARSVLPAGFSRAKNRVS